MEKSTNYIPTERLTAARQYAQGEADALLYVHVLLSTREPEVVKEIVLTDYNSTLDKLASIRESIRARKEVIS